MDEYKTTWREKLGYGIGAVGLDLSYGMFYSYLSYYLSSVLGLKEGFLLLLTPLARIWDGVNDPMMGTIVDNTKTKMGKYRPWIIIGALSNAVVLTLLFTSFGMSGTRLYVYIAFMYILWGMTNTMADIPYWSMVPSFTSDPKDRNLVATVARTFSGIGQGTDYHSDPADPAQAVRRYHHRQGVQRLRLFSLGTDLCHGAGMLLPDLRAKHQRASCNLQGK